MPELNAGVAQSYIMTANWISRPLGYGWQRHVCCLIDSPIGFNFVHAMYDGVDEINNVAVVCRLDGKEYATIT